MSASGSSMTIFGPLYSLEAISASSEFARKAKGLQPERAKHFPVAKRESGRSRGIELTMIGSVECRRTALCSAHDLKGRNDD